MMLKSGAVRHMVIFCLHAGRDNEEANKFLKESVEALAPIPGVEKFEALRQVSGKNDYDYGFSMEFVNQAAYDAYNSHPVHVEYVQERWQKEVSRFLEIDLTGLEHR